MSTIVDEIGDAKKSYVWRPNEEGKIVQWINSEKSDPLLMKYGGTVLLNVGGEQ